MIMIVKTPGSQVKIVKCRIGTENLNIALGVSVRGGSDRTVQSGTSIWYLNLVPGTLVLWYLSGIKSVHEPSEPSFFFFRNIITKTKNLIDTCVMVSTTCMCL